MKSPSRIAIALRLVTFLFAVCGSNACAQFDSKGSAVGFLFLPNGGLASSALTDTTDGTDPATTVTDTVVKQIQTGTVAMSGATQTVTVSAVDMTRAFVFCHFQLQNSAASSAPTCQLASSTQISVNVGVAAADIIVYWQLIEFSSGASVQRGALNMGAADTSAGATLSTVNRNKTFALVYARSTNTANNVDQRRLVTGRFTSATDLLVERQATGDAIDIEWQVVELESASVQSGLTTIASGTSVQTEAVSSVNTGSSFFIMNYSAAAVVAGIDKNYSIIGSINSATQIEFRRFSATGDLNANWFLVDLNGATVQTGTTSTAPAPHTETQIDTTITALDTSKAFAVAYSTMDGALGAAAMESLFWAPSFTSTTNLRLERGIDNATVAGTRWYAVELQ